MKNLKRQLEVLEAIENAPTPLSLIPVTIIKEDDTVMIPTPVMKYLEEQGGNIELDQNGNLDVNKYNALLTKHHLGINQLRCISFKAEPEVENVKLDY